MHTQSEILANSVSFALRKEASAFLKAREAVVKCKHASAMDDLKAAARFARQRLEALMAITEQDFSADEVIENFVGLGKVWSANDSMIIKTATEQGISYEQAREILEVSLTQAQLYAQSTRANLLGIYEGWLCDLAPQVHQAAAQEANNVLQTIIQEAYAKAGEWLRRDEGLLIEATAKDWEFTLPKWADVLPKLSEATVNAKRKIEQRLDQRAEQLRDAYMAAASQIDNSDW